MPSKPPPDFAIPTPRPLPRELWPNIDHVVTEDDERLERFSSLQQSLLVAPLYSWWSKAQDGDFTAHSNVGLFYDADQPPFVPDMMLSLNIDPPRTIQSKEDLSYFLWVYGKPPDVVAEVASSTKKADDDDRMAGYARIRVPYYAVYDWEREHHHGDGLRVYWLENGHYREMSKPYWLPGVELGLRTWRGEYHGGYATWLRWFEADGELIPTDVERIEAAENRILAPNQ